MQNAPIACDAKRQIRNVARYSETKRLSAATICAKRPECSFVSMRSPTAFHHKDTKSTKRCLRVLCAFVMKRKTAARGRRSNVADFSLLLRRFDDDADVLSAAGAGHVQELDRGVVV